ncbi:hypothetical protein AT1219_50005 [Vibrio alginolyticus]
MLRNSSVFSYVVKRFVALPESGEPPDHLELMFITLLQLDPNLSLTNNIPLEFFLNTLDLCLTHRF